MVLNVLFVDLLKYRVFVQISSCKDGRRKTEDRILYLTKFVKKIW